jgi:hypothetical protein
MQKISGVTVANGRTGMVPERRAARRIRTVYRIVRIAASGDEGLARILNMSDSGMKLSTGIPVRPGDTVRVSLSDTLMLSGRVIWTQGDECGLLFDRPVDSIKALHDTAEQTRSGDFRPVRLRADFPSVVTCEHGLMPVLILDISQQGMKITHDGTFTVGLAVKVILCSGVEKCGHIRWVNGRVAGLLLTEQFSAADLGSVRALRSTSSH